MANTVDKVIAIAKAEVGYLEKSKAAYNKSPAILDSKTEGSGRDNYTKYGRDMHNIYPQVMDFPAAWCDCFVDWCFMKAYGVSNAKALLCGKFDDYTVNSAGLYKNKGQYFKRGTTLPKVGDQIFFTNGKRICHTGLVYKVDSTKVYTIEGNTSGGSTLVPNGGGVAMKSYPHTYGKIDGYGRPKYDNVEVAPVVETSSEIAMPTLKKKSIGTEVKKLQKNLNSVIKAKLAVDGDFGPATERAVKEFQKKFLLKIDGIYGPKSYNKMINVLL